MSGKGGAGQFRFLSLASQRHSIRSFLTDRFLVGSLFIGSLLMGSLFFGCAKPTYVNSDSSDGSPNPQGKPENLCPISFLLVPSKTPGYCLKWRWETSPEVGKPTSLIFKVYRLNAFDTPFEMDPSLSPKLVLWMPSMGHGSRPTTIETLDPMTFRAKDIYFIMEGAWDLQFQLLDKLQLQERADVPVTI